MGDLLSSFFVGGFESSTMRRKDGRRNDLVAATRHDELAERDYTRLLEVGVSTVREGVAWHLTEPRRGRFDPAPVLGRIRAAERLGVQVIWDLCHFGWPDDVDPFRADFADRLAAHAQWFARVLRDESSATPWYVPVNEPSFVAWGGGDVAYLNPFARGRGPELKRQLVAASLAAAGACREVDPRARICHVDPVIHVEPRDGSPESVAAAARYSEAQFEAWDMLGGRRDDDLGGAEAELDLIGVNFYDRNQWVDGGPTLGVGDPGFRPLRLLLADVHDRYRRPILIAETGTEGDARVPWLRYVCDEVAAAQAKGVEIAGVCLYPIVDYPGWDDDRHVPVGAWGYPDEAGDRPPYQPLLDELDRQRSRFEPPAAVLGRSPRQTTRPGSLQPAGWSGRSVWRRGDPARRRTRAIALVTDSRVPSGMGRLMLTLGRGLIQDHRVIVAAPDAIDARWLLRDAEASGLEAWPLVDGGPQAQAASLHDRLAERAIDLVDVHAGIGWEGHAAIAAARLAGVPAVVRTEHLPFLLEKDHERRQYLAALAGVDRVVAVSEGVARSHIAAGVPAELIRVARNGIEDPAPSARADVRGAIGLPRDARLVVSVGRLTAQKGYDVLLGAAAGVIRSRPDAHVVIVGAGPLASTLDAMIDELGIRPNVHRLASWEDVPVLLAAADVTVLASRFEGLPLVGLEAMAVGRPVVGTRVCGLDEIIEDGVTGRLVAPDDPGALAAAVLELLADPAAAARWGAAGRRRYESSFTARRMTEDTVRLFDEVWSDAARMRASPRSDRLPAATLPGNGR